jgi:hypothetical protein
MDIKRKKTMESAAIEIKTIILPGNVQDYLS